MTSFAQAQSALLNQTWTIHRLSLLTTPLSQTALIQSLPTDMDAQWLLGDEDDDRTRMARNNEGEQQDEEQDDKGETFRGNETSNSNENAHKRRRLDDCNTAKMHHLRIRHYMDDKVSATVVFCFASWSKESETSCAIQRFAYCLVRGAKTYCETIFAWMEQVTGNYIGRRPVLFPPAHLTTILYQWMLRRRNSNHQNSSSPSVEFKFELPKALANKNLSEIMYTIPPAELDSLCQAQLKQDGKDDDETANESSDAASPSFTLVSGELLLRAVHNYVSRSMKLQLKAFLLSQLTWEAAAFGSNGQVKPKCKDSVLFILTEVKLLMAMR
jgi:hypothetical protein